jgi:hypothetical protein
MPELREVFELTTKQMGEPDVDSWREQEKRQRNASRNKKIGAFAVAAAIAVVAVAWIVGTRGGQDTTTPANQPTVNPADPTAEEVAMGFLEAYGAYDADQAITFLADDADLSGLVPYGTREDFRLLFSFNEATGLKKMLTSCEETGNSAFGTDVRCTFDFHAIRSDEIGRGPYSGSYFDLTVRDGEIVGGSEYFEIAKFSPQMWEPFVEWVSTNYPEDAAVMYIGDYADYRLSLESIRLWEQHTREYVKELQR